MLQHPTALGACYGDMLGALVRCAASLVDGAASGELPSGTYDGLPFAVKLQAETNPTRERAYSDASGARRSHQVRLV